MNVKLLEHKSPEEIVFLLYEYIVQACKHSSTVVEIAPTAPSNADVASQMHEQICQQVEETVKNLPKGDAGK